jgi:ABC-type Mn2+/Zn2+ transport system permease subunit
MAVATHSVVRYQLWIVIVYTLLAGLLVFWVLRSDRTTPVVSAVVVGGGLAVGFVLVAVLHLTVRLYTYLTPGDGWLVRSVLAASAVLVALALLGSVLTERRHLADHAQPRQGHVVHGVSLAMR